MKNPLFRRRAGVPPIRHAVQARKCFILAQLVAVAVRPLIAQPAGAPVLELRPAKMTFVAHDGTQRTGQRLTIRVGDGRVAWRIAVNASWLQVAPAEGRGDATAFVGADTTGLAPGSYAGRITVSAPGAARSPQAVDVLLVVARRTPVSESTLTVTPDRIVFGAPAGDRSPMQFELRVAAQPDAAVGWSATASAPWIVLSPASGTTPSRIVVSIDAASRPAGLGEAAITIRASGSTGEVTVPVLLQRAAGGPLTLDASPMLPNAVLNVPYAYNLAAQGGQPPYAWRIDNGQLPAELALINGAITGVPRVPGAFLFVVTVTDSAVPPVVISRTFGLNVVITQPGTDLLVEPERLDFSATAGKDPPAQLVRVSNTQNVALGWAASSNARWLVLSPTAGNAPANLAIGVVTRGLTAGIYNGTVTITMPGSPNSPMILPVTLNVR